MSTEVGILSFCICMSRSARASRCKGGSPAKVGGDLCSQVVLNLQTVIFHSSCCRSIIVLLGPKERKAPAHGCNSLSVLLFVNCVNSLIRTSFAVSILSAVCRVLRNSLRATIWWNLYSHYAQTASHNGLHPAGIYTVLLTVPVSL